jgi:5-methylcytosine-specific restriction endonuclease McrA
MDKFPKELRQKIQKHLRRIGYYNVTYATAMKSAHQGFGLGWKCCKCGTIGKREDLHGDHIEAVDDPTSGFVDWNSYMSRLFLGQIQPLCKTCHKEKSAQETKIRAERRKK